MTIAQSYSSDGLSGAAVGISAYSATQASKARESAESALRIACSEKYIPSECDKVCISEVKVGIESKQVFTEVRQMQKVNACTGEVSGMYTQEGVTLLSVLLIVFSAIIVILAFFKISNNQYSA